MIPAHLVNVTSPCSPFLSIAPSNLHSRRLRGAGLVLDIQLRHLGALWQPIFVHVVVMEMTSSQTSFLSPSASGPVGNLLCSALPSVSLAYTSPYSRFVYGNPWSKGKRTETFLASKHRYSVSTPSSRYPLRNPRCNTVVPISISPEPTKRFRTISPI